MTKECKISLFNDSMDGVFINSDGISNIALNALWRLKNECYFNDPQNLKNLVSKIKSKKSKDGYDCVIGLSGGFDSTFLALKAKENGLNPLAVHLDNGWNTNLSISNIEKIVKKLNIELLTKVVNWSEMKDLQRSYIKASVLDLECVSDHAINTILYETAAKFGIKYILNGNNIKTEGNLPSTWVYNKLDGINLLDIHKKFGESSIKTFPHMLPFRILWLLFVKKIKFISLLNYLDFKKKDALIEIQEKLDYIPYERKHGENLFTTFFQEIYLPKKFSIDKRVSHLSSLIISGEISKEEAKKELSKPILKDNQELEITEYVAKKLGFKYDEFQLLINAKPAKHTDFKNISNFLYYDNTYLQIIRYLAKGELNFNNLKNIYRKDKMRL